MPSDPQNPQKSVASSVRSAFGVDENLQEDTGPSFFQRIVNALKGSDSLSSKINSAIQRKQDK